MKPETLASIRNAARNAREENRAENARKIEAQRKAQDDARLALVAWEYKVSR